MTDDLMTMLDEPFEGGENNPMNHVREALRQAHSSGNVEMTTRLHDAWMLFVAIVGWLLPRFSRTGQGVASCRQGNSSCVAAPAFPPRMHPDLPGKVRDRMQQILDEGARAWQGAVDDALRVAREDPTLKGLDVSFDHLEYIITPSGDQYVALAADHAVDVEARVDVDTSPRTN